MHEVGQFTDLLSRLPQNQEGCKQNKLNLPMWEFPPVCTKDFKMMDCLEK